MSIRQAVGFHMVIWLSGLRTISPTSYEAAGWQPGQAESVGNDRITVAALRPQDLLEDAFRPIARDGAGTIEVVLRLLHSLEILAQHNPHLREAALDAAQDAAGHAQRALTAPSDLQALHSASQFAVSA
jgi:uncharacterized membrane protein